MPRPKDAKTRRARTLRTLIWIPIAVVASVGALRAASPPPATLLQGPSRGSLHVLSDARGNYRVGDFSVSLTETSMTVIHPNALAAVWASPSDEGFLSAATAETQVSITGNLARVVESWEGELSEQIIQRAHVDSMGALWTYGELRQPKDQGNERITWQARWRENKDTKTLEVTVQAQSAKVNRVAFSTKMESDEHFYGGGISYSQPDHKAILAMPRFQGVGRGDQPLTLIEDLHTGTGGSTDTSQAPLARVTTDAPRTQWVTSDNPVVVDGRQSGRLSMTSWSNEVNVTLASRRTPAEQIGQMVQQFGPMRQSPSWGTDGPIISDPGNDNEHVLANVDRWIAAGIPPKAVMLRHIPASDKGAALQAQLHERGVRMIAVVKIGDPVEGMHVDGFMVEGAELLILNAEYQDTLEDWSEELRKAVSTIDKPVVLTQAIVDGYAHEPMAVNIGNLNANFSQNDGLGTAVNAMVNGGISGLAFTNVTVGGDTTIDRPVWMGGVKRTEEHIARSAQLAAFSAMFRIGLDTPDSGVQMGTDPVAQDHIKRWYLLRRALTPIRNRLNEQAVKEGIPPVRDAMLVLPDDRSFDPSETAFFYGDDIYVSPVTEPGQTQTTISLPQGNWRNVWTGESHLVRRGEHFSLTMDTPIDRFPLFARVGSSSDQVLNIWAKNHVPRRVED